ncbi:hypothetical protein EV360DRAFT_84399 [Lentinula raphanica]|nr:hypothetical protein EV360DRAFT_84399 [Lentinula raphanica]
MPFPTTAPSTCILDLNMTNVGRRYTKSSHTSPEEDIPRLEADFQRFFVADPKASRPPTREIFDLYREGTDAHTPSHSPLMAQKNISLPSFREFQEASLRRLSSTNATFKWPAVRHSFDEERHMIRRPSTTSFRNEAWNSSASRLTSTTASEYTTPISETGSIDFMTRSFYTHSHAINASEMYEGGVPNFRKRKELFDDSDASPSPTLSYRGSQFSPTAVAQQQIGCQHCLSRMVTSSFSETVHTFRRPRSSSVDYSDSQNHGKADSGWKWFVHASPDEDGKTIYSCQWAGCNSFKHLSNVKEKNYKTHKSTLIKRHIESTHMKLKFVTYSISSVIVFYHLHSLNL